MAERESGFGALSVRVPLRVRGGRGRRFPQGARAYARGRAARVPLVLVIAVSSALALSAGPSAASSPCVAYANCAPSNINFETPGSVPLTNFNNEYCGIVGSYAPLADQAIDKTYDDPLALGSNAEGNYTDSEAVEFQPATGLTGGDYVKVTLPHPAEPYTTPPPGAVLPAPDISSGESSEQQDSTLTITPGANDESFSAGTDNASYEYPIASPSPSTFSFYVTVFASGLAPGSSLDLAGLDPSQRQSLVFPAQANVGGVSIQGYDVNNQPNYDLGNFTNVTFPATGGSVGYFLVTVSDTLDQPVVFAATDATNKVPLAQTAAAYVNGNILGSGPCVGAEVAPSPSPYVLVQHNTQCNCQTAYPLAQSAVSVTQASGVTSATVTVPSDVFNTDTSNDTVTLEMLDVTSPPGLGTPDQKASNPLYNDSQFTVSTAEDPVPGYASNFPTFVADANNSTNLEDNNALDPTPCWNSVGIAPSARIDPCNSTLIPSTGSGSGCSPSVTSCTQVSATGGSTVTATVNDLYNNPVNLQNVEVFQTPAGNAVVTPEAPTPTQGNPNPPATSPSGDNGAVTYTASDTCAETITIEAVDISGNNNSYQVDDAFPDHPGNGTASSDFPTIQYTPGQAIAPDSSAWSPSTCTGRSYPSGQTTVKSCISVGTASGAPVCPAPVGGASTASVAGDGVSSTTVTVQLGDQFGNAVTDTCVELSQQTASGGATHATVGPTPASTPPASAGCSTGSAYTDASGIASFTVADTNAEDVVFSVFGPAIPPWPTNPASDPSDVVTVDFLGVDAALSTVSPSQSSNVPGNGFPSATVTVHLVDQSGEAEQDKVVSLAANPSDPSTTIAPLLIPIATSGCPQQVAAGTTDCNGQAEFTVADNCVSLPVPCTPSVEHSVTYQATDTSDTVVVNSQSGPLVIGSTTISFTSGGATISATPSIVVADGPSSFSTVQVNLEDTNGMPVQGATVSLTPNPATTATATAVVIPDATSHCLSQAPAGSTDCTGQAQFEVSDTKAEVVALTALAIYSPTSPSLCPSLYNAGTGKCSISLPVTVTFVSAPSTLTAVASPTSVPADGVTTSQVTVTALDANKNPISGLPLQLVAPAGNSTAFVQAQVVPTTTGSNGEAVFSVSDTAAETLVLTAEYGLAHGLAPATFSALAAPAGQVSVTFTPTPDEIEAADSTVGIIPCAPPTPTTPSGAAPADGTSPVCVKVTLMASPTRVISGHPVILTTSSATTAVQPTAYSPATGTCSTSPTSDVGGLTVGGSVCFAITDTVPESGLTVYATDLYTGVIIGQTTTISFTTTEAQASTITASPNSLPAGGATTTVAVTLEDGLGDSFAGHTVALTPSSSTVSASLRSTTPGPNGSVVAVFAVSDSAVETVTVGAVDTTGGVGLGIPLDATVTIAFTGSEANQSSVTITPTTTPADGPAATLTVTVRNGSGVPVPCEHISITSTSSSSTSSSATVTPESTSLSNPANCPSEPANGTPGYTDTNGQAKFAVSDTAIETVTLSACDLTAHPNALDPTCPSGGVSTTLLRQTATISFTPGEINQSTLTVSPTSLPAGGFKGALVLPTTGCTTSPPTQLCDPTAVVTVTLLSGGRLPLVGHSVSLAATSSTVSIVPATATTNSSGQATFTIGDSVAETATLSAFDLTTGVPVLQKAPVTFTADEANQSTVTATPGVGATWWTVTVTFKNPTPLAGDKVAVSAYVVGTTVPYALSKTASVTVLSKNGVSTATGQIQFMITDSQTQTLSIAVRDTTTNTQLLQLYQPLVLTVFR